MIKIFFLDKTIYLIDSKSTYIPKSNSILQEIQAKEDLQKIHSELILKKEFDEIYYFNNNLEQLYSYFASSFQYIEAAGGLVKNKEGKWLFIFRNGKWDLPKGKIENGESTNVAAIREVEEECSVSGLIIIKELRSTYHIYEMQGTTFLKRTYWFEMTCSDDSKLTPQLEEGITEVKWISGSDLSEVYNNTYKSIEDVLEELKDV